MFSESSLLGVAYLRCYLSDMLQGQSEQSLYINELSEWEISRETFVPKAHKIHRNGSETESKLEFEDPAGHQRFVYSNNYATNLIRRGDIFPRSSLRLEARDTGKASISVDRPHTSANNSAHTVVSE